MKSIENFEEYVAPDRCKKALHLFLKSEIKFKKLDDFAKQAYIEDNGKTFEVTVSYDPQTGEVFDFYSFCECQEKNCEHKLALIFAIRESCLGAQAVMTPPDIFEAKVTKAIADAAELYTNAPRVSALELAKSALSSQDPMTVALGFSSFMKLAIRDRRSLNIGDVKGKTGIMAISMMGDEAYQDGNIGMAADLQSIALDALDSMENLAWANKYYAKREKKAIFEKLDALAELAQPDVGKRMISVFTSVAKQACCQDTILGLINSAGPLGREYREWISTFVKLISEERNMPLHSDEHKEAMLALYALADAKAGAERIKDSNDRYYELRVIDMLAESGDLRTAIVSCTKKLEQYKTADWGWKLCALYEKMGDKAGLRATREEMAFNMNLTDDEYFENLGLMKELYTELEWKYIETSLVWEMKGKTSNPQVYQPRYIRFLKLKGDSEQLFKACSLQPEIFDDVFRILSPNYSAAELNDMFRRYIIGIVQEGNTKTYLKVCEQLKSYHKLGFDANSARQGIVEAFARRPALVKMLGELRLD
ncbi:MAG: hypothetical protein LBT59_22200 [Clostridiales bacterium]|jgi:hypothetical protein|nr:hypothetical protein [Clostridiales bacterium]